MKVDPTVAIQIGILIILLLLSSFFSSAETALTCANKVKLKTLSDDGSKSAARVLKILENPGKMLSTILIGNNIVNITTTSLATIITIKLFGNVYVGIMTAILTVLILLFGEIVPKTAANVHSEKLALLYAPVIAGLMWLLTPIIFVVDKLSVGILKLMHINVSGAEDIITENELKTYVEASHEDGEIEPEEKEMILNVFDLGDSLAKDIMVPRIEMVMIDVEASYNDVKNIFKNSLYSRIPVYEGDKDKIIGVINIKDFFLVSRKADFKIRNIMRDIYVTYESKKTDDLLAEMREGAQSIALVLDEYGAPAGLITLEDLLEEIVGEIRDEYDTEERELLKEIGPNTYDIAGSMKLDDINDRLDTKFDSEDFDSIGGLMIEALDHFPQLNETAILEDGTTIKAVELNKMRIMRVILTIAEAKEVVSEGDIMKVSDIGENDADANTKETN